MGAFVLALVGFVVAPAWAGTVSSVDYKGTAPTNSVYALGDDIEVEITFAAVVHVDETGDLGDLVLVLNIGEHSRNATFVEGSGTTKLLFRYTVQSGDEDTDGISIGPGIDADQGSLVGGAIRVAGGTLAARTFNGKIPDANRKVDGVIPKVVADGVVVTTPGPDMGDTYGLAEDIGVTVTFDETVHVDETVEELVLVLSIGQHSRQATFVGGSGSTTLRFSYTVQRGDADDDGISIGAGPNSLVGARIEDSAGNPVDRTFDSLPQQAGHKVDGVTPSLNAVRITSNPQDQVSGFYGLDEEIKVAVGFGEEVHATDPNDDLELIIAIGQHSRSAQLADGSGTNTLTFSYTVQSDDYDGDGISVGPAALRGGVIEDAAGNPADRNFPGLGAASAHKVDGIRPSLREVRIVSRPANVKYGLNEEIRVEVDFDEEVHVDETETELVLVLAIGQHSRSATFVEGSGTDTLKFSYVVQSGDYDVDGISIGPASNPGGVGSSLQGAALRDKAGNVADRTFLGLAADDMHKVDGVQPSMKRVEVTSTPGPNNTYGLNEEIRVNVDFGEVVFVDESDSELTLVLSIGQHSRAAAYVDGGGTDTLVFAYAVQADDLDEDGISIGPNALRGGVISDTAGNLVDRTSAGVAAKPLHKVDGSITSRDPARPSLTSVRFVSRPGPDRIYGLGDEIKVAVVFSEEVHVTNTALDLAILLSIGQYSREALFESGSGTDTLTFTYVVQAEDSDDDGISISPDPLRGGVIQDAAGNDVDRSFSGREVDNNHKVDGSDASASRTPVSIVSSPGSSGFYGLGDEIRIEVRFGEEVHVEAGPPRLVISIGEHLREATMTGGSGTDTLTFRYVVRTDDYDEDGISTGPNPLRDGTIQDVVGNPVDRSFVTLAADSDHKVDGVSPSLEEVRIVSTPANNDTYGSNEAIRVEVEFGEEVHVTASDLSLTLSIGENLRAAEYVSGSGTDTLTFRYVVQSGDSDEDGISISASALSGDGIEDVAGNEVVPTFDGLEADSDHKVDGIGPELTAVRIASTPDATGYYGLNDAITVEVEFGEEVHVTSGEADLSLMLSIGQHLRAATFVSGSGTDTLTFRYVVQAGDSDEDGISIGPSALRGGTIADAAGNVVVRTFGGLAANDGHKVKAGEALVPAAVRLDLTSNAGSNNTYTTDDNIGVDVVFNVPVHVRGDAPVLSLSIGSMERDAVFQEGSGTRILKFQYTVVLGDTDDDGISIGPNALTGNIEDGGGNAVDLTLPALVAQASHKVSAELMLYPLSLTLVVGEAQTVNLTDQLVLLGVDYDGHFEATSDDTGIATASLSGRSLTITSVAEGAATVTAKAVDAAIFLFFGVTVATSPEEKAVLEGALAAVGRGMVASAASTIGARLESIESGPQDTWGGSGLAPASSASQSQWSAFDRIDHLGSTFGHGPWGVDDPYLERSMGYTLGQWLRGARFEMPFGGYGNQITSWSVWGAGDWHAFEGKPESGLYDGSLTSVYLGIDARGNGWISGAAISHAIADASYEFGGGVAGKGRLETELNVIHPYLQWAFRDRGKVWAILGFGTGEAMAEREGQEASKASSDLSMLMGVGGMRYAFGPWAGFDFAVRGDAGFAKLETDEGPRAIEGLTVNVHRVRMGVEASLPMAFVGIPVSPFIDVAGRYDGGDGATGGGLEVAGGFRYQGSMVGLEVKGRALAMHSDDSYSEEGVKATLAIGPDGRRGFRLQLSPRWGGTAEAMDIFTFRGHPFAGALRRESRGWGLGTRMSYGFDMQRRPGTIMPYWELDLSRDTYRRARLGVSYELASAFAGMPHRFEISGESTESDRHGSIMGFLLSGEAHF